MDVELPCCELSNKVENMAGKWFCFISALLPNDPSASAHVRCDCNVILVNLRRLWSRLATAVLPSSAAPAPLRLGQHLAQVLVQGPARNAIRRGKKRAKCDFL